MKRAPGVRISFLTVVIAIAALGCAAGRAVALPYVQTNLVSDIPGLASITDTELKNPWGVSESSTSPFWVSNQATNSSTLYTVSGSTNVSKVAINPPSGFVAIPTTGAGPQGPTGQVNNGNASSFAVGNGGNGGSAHFIFANLNGTISAWDTGATAFVQATTAGAIYTGLAINTAQTRLYAANDAGVGGIDVFNSSFGKVSLPAGAFTHPNLPAGYVPFNVQDIGGKVYVTYAVAGRANQTSAAAGMGVVAVYDENGVLQQTLISGSQLASPWGLAIAPADFGTFSNDLLVSNFSYADSAINAYSPVTGAFLGTIPINIGSNAPGGLWALAFGNNASGGASDTLYFADGINSETDGLFAAISVPEPSAAVLLGTSLVFLGVFMRKRLAK
ncbi:MAG: TIGR03118 family protein [Acetobacteraceae bacterium]|nr:TIGR03118 family protein [Acetobacteraceae bacterium]